MRSQSVSRLGNQPLHGQHSNEQQHDEREDGKADAAACAAERDPDFFVQVEPIGLRFAYHDTVAQAAECQAVAHLHIVQPLCRRGGDGAGLLEAPDDLPLMAQYRDHTPIVPQTAIMIGDRHDLTSWAGDLYYRHSHPMPNASIPPGTLVMIVLRVLQTGPLHGYAIAQRIHQITSDVLQVEEGSLYPALQRILLKGWAKAEWGVSETNRRVRFYRLTPGGRKQLETEMADYERVNAAIRAVLRIA
jgi:PadR family transcriptional regulator PadR